MGALEVEEGEEGGGGDDKQQEEVEPHGPLPPQYIYIYIICDSIYIYIMRQK